MKNLFHLTIFLLLSIPSFGQMVMTAQGVNPENLCKPNTVYFLMEQRARPMESMDSIQVRLNNKVTFAKENPSLESKVSIQFAVNCRGEIGGGFHVVTKSGNDTFDSELIEFFKTIKKWNAGKIKKKTVDSWYMWRLEVKSGNITILNK